MNIPTKKNKRLPNTKLALLRRVPSLRACNDQDLADLSRHIDELDVETGFVLTTQGDIGKEAFVIVDGWAKVTIDDEPVTALGPGAFVGEVAMLDHGVRTATVVATTAMHLLVIGPQAFSTVASQPHVAKSITRSLAERLRQADAALGKGRTRNR